MKKITMMQSDVAAELKHEFTSHIEELSGLKCGAEQVIIDGIYADVTLCIAFAHKNSDELTALISQNKGLFTLYNIPIIDRISTENGYINITLNDEVLECIANKITESLPEPEHALGRSTDYAIIRAYMMSRKSDAFAEKIKEKALRKAFLSAINISGSEKRLHHAANAFLEAEKRMTSYDGMGKIGNCIAKLLYYNTIICMKGD